MDSIYKYVYTYCMNIEHYCTMYSHLKSEYTSTYLNVDKLKLSLEVQDYQRALWPFEKDDLTAQRYVCNHLKLLNCCRCHHFQ